MEYARGLLKKYGWTEGKGLGKNETGISEPLKPKLKFDTTGIGHDHSEQFTFNWWELAFNNAASRVDVKLSNSPGACVKSSKKDDLILSTKKPWIAKLEKDKALEYGSFVKTETLTHEGKLIPMDTNPIPLEDEQVSVVALTSTLSDDELFRICGGRTAHKAARHGHKLVGKLARVNKQEKHKISSGLQENCSEPSDTIISDSKANDVCKKKRKKRKVTIVESDKQSSFECENGSDVLPNENNEEVTIESLNKRLGSDCNCKFKESKKKKKRCFETDSLGLENTCDHKESRKKKKKCFETDKLELENVCELQEPKKKKKNKCFVTDTLELENVCELQEPKKKRKKYSKTDTIELDSVCEVQEPKKKCSEIEVLNVDAPSKKTCKVTVFPEDSDMVCTEKKKSKKKT